MIAGWICSLAGHADILGTRAGELAMYSLAGYARCLDMRAGWICSWICSLTVRFSKASKNVLRNSCFRLVLSTFLPFWLRIPTWIKSTKKMGHCKSTEKMGHGPKVQKKWPLGQKCRKNGPWAKHAKKTEKMGHLFPRWDPEPKGQKSA